MHQHQRSTVSLSLSLSLSLSPPAPVHKRIRRATTVHAVPLRCVTCERTRNSPTRLTQALCWVRVPASGRETHPSTVTTSQHGNTKQKRSPKSGLLETRKQKQLQNTNKELQSSSKSSSQKQLQKQPLETLPPLLRCAAAAPAGPLRRVPRAPKLSIAESKFSIASCSFSGPLRCVRGGRSRAAKLLRESLTTPFSRLVKELPSSLTAPFSCPYLVPVPRGPGSKPAPPVLAPGRHPNPPTPAWGEWPRARRPGSATTRAHPGRGRGNECSGFGGLADRNQGTNLTSFGALI